MYHEQHAGPSRPGQVGSPEAVTTLTLNLDHHNNRVPDPEEMCAFFFLYESVGENASIVWDQSVFNTPGPPRYSWAIDREVPKPIPAFVDASASDPGPRSEEQEGDSPAGGAMQHHHHHG